MSEGWHYLAFGMELGPMSWEDLRNLAVRGDLRPDNPVRQGAAATWMPAGEIPGLFEPLAAEPLRDEWYCEILGAELGPMSSSELRLLAERGNIRGDIRVRRGDSCEWVLASSLVELASLVGLSAAKTDVELIGAQEIGRPANAPKLIAGETPTNKGASDACDIGLNSGGLYPPSNSAELDDREPVVKLAATRPSANEVEPVEPPSSTVANVAAAPKTTRRETAAQRPAVHRAPRQSISFHIPWRLLAGVTAMAAVIGVGYLAHLRMATPTTDHRQVASAYRQIYEQLKQFRQAPRSRSAEGMKFQFSRSVAALRKQFATASPNSVQAKLGRAGSYLSEMLNNFNAQPGSPEESTFAESEQQFLKIIDDVAKEPSQ